VCVCRDSEGFTRHRHEELHCRDVVAYEYEDRCLCCFVNGLNASLRQSVYVSRPEDLGCCFMRAYSLVNKSVGCVHEPTDDGTIRDVTATQ
jgi:hypothetical protein